MQVLYQKAGGHFSASVRVTDIDGETEFEREHDIPLLVDWNGDGEPGVGFLDKSERLISYSPDRYQGSVPVNLLRNIRNNFGVNTDIEYAQLNDSNVYRKKSAKHRKLYYF